MKLVKTLLGSYLGTSQFKHTDNFTFQQKQLVIFKLLSLCFESKKQ